MANTPRRTDANTAPTDFPKTTPPISMGQDNLLLQTVLTMQGTLGGLAKQIEGMERKLDKVADEVAKHGRWLFAAYVGGAVILAIVGLIAKFGG